MIHYTLLPENEVKILRKEYRLRLTIIFLFVLSLAVVVGILALLPSYIHSRSQLLIASEQTKVLEKGRQERGADQIEKELVQAQALVDKIKEHEDGMFFSNNIKDIFNLRTSGISIYSFDISRNESTTTPITVVIGGRASTRESLVSFKESLESDKRFSKVELPISDLAKSKNISFAFRLTISN